MEYLFILGRHPELSAAEILAVLAQTGVASTLVTATSDFMILETSAPLSPITMPRLGGTERIAQVIKKADKPWDVNKLTETLSPLPPKFRLGISLLNWPSRLDLKKFGGELKRRLTDQGSKVRFILGSDHRLNAAQLIFNKLTTEPNYELIMAHHNGRYFLAKTMTVQDIQAYERRDTARPQRDARVGMLPPKLAQVMVNLATRNFPSAPLTIFDPFCGMGTILQEGALMGHTMIGSDSNAEMLHASQENLASLQLTAKLFQHDAQQVLPRELTTTIDAIVTEPYLGRPLTAPLSPEAAASEIDRLGALYLTFFEQAMNVLKANGRILFLLPAFRKGMAKGSRFTLFPDGFLDAVAEKGYVLDQLIPSELASYFPVSPRKTALYARPDALVGRELTLWKKL